MQMTITFISSCDKACPLFKLLCNITIGRFLRHPLLGKTT